MVTLFNVRYLAVKVPLINFKLDSFITRENSVQDSSCEH